MRARVLIAASALLAWLGPAVPALADGQAIPTADAPAATRPSPAEAQAAKAPSPAYDEDLDPIPAEPDFYVITLPTNLRLPKHKLDFRLTHRFARGLSQGSFGDLASDFFGFDGGA